MNFNENEMISISGLNSKQMAMMDVIWSCQDESQFLEWYLALSHADRLVAESLLEILRQEFIEKFLEMDSMDEAKTTLDRIFKK
jgi:hypothetical protein